MPTSNTVRTVEYANSETFNRLVLEAEVPVLVDFYADWCRPCQMLAPVLEKFAAETANVRVVKVNVDENPQLAARYNVTALPTLLVFKQGRVTAQHVGLAKPTTLKALIE